jgi:hypothetical protein
MVAAPPVRVLETAIFLRPVRTRLPFRYGRAVMTEAPVAHLRVRAEVGGVPAAGASGAILPPLWFDKSPGRTHEDDIRDLLRSLREAAAAYREAGAADPWALHRAAAPAVRKRLSDQNDLTAGFGAALLDLAVADAVCRATGRTFHEALRDDLLGFGPLPLPPRPRRRIFVRHTVGLGDPIDATEGAPRVGDGLPETLEEVVRAYGVRYFKVKISGDPGETLARLRRVATALDRWAGSYRVTLDGNEQFHAPEEVGRLLDALERDPALRRFRRRTLWVEQPLERGAALARPLGDLARRTPILIDESDGDDGAAERAAALGYAGVSVKSAKGLYRALLNFRRRRASGGILSSEDLMNLPIVPLHEDLALAAALGIAHSERNGHHYVRGGEFLSPRERRAALEEYPSLYAEGPGGVPRLRVERGMLDLSEVNGFAFGVRSEPDWASLERAA